MPLVCLSAVVEYPVRIFLCILEIAVVRFVAYIHSSRFHLVNGTDRLSFVAIVVVCGEIARIED